MLAVNQQPLIDRIYAKSAVKKSKFMTCYSGKKSWNWDFYGDIVYHAFNTPYSLVATNLTNDEVQTILRCCAAKRLCFNDTRSKKQIADLIANHHCADCIDVKYLQAMVEVQQFRDGVWQKKSCKHLHRTFNSCLIPCKSCFWCSLTFI